MHWPCPKGVGKSKRKNKDLGRCKLKDDVIGRLQNYYGIAIRSNVGDLQSMKSAVFAALFHVASSAENVWHNRCRKGSSSWCGYQRDISYKTSLYKPGVGLSNDVEALTSIILELSDKLLKNVCTERLKMRMNHSMQ